MEELLKNPMFIGVSAGAIVYFYLQWDYKNKAKSGKKQKEVNLLIPLIAAVLFSLISYSYFNSSYCGNYVPDTTVRGIGNKYKFTKHLTSESPASFHLISKGINMPNNLPDVFIETY